LIGSAKLFVLNAVDGWFAPVFLCSNYGGDIINKDLRINDAIRAREVRLVGSDGEQLGIVSLRDAMASAVEKECDLVEIAPTARPPVCKLMDYGKFKYEQAKRDKETRKRQNIVTIKEVKLRPNIEDHDFDTKARNARRFLADGDKVKVTIMFRGRELSHPEQGKQLCVRLAELLKDEANIERDAKVEGRNMIMILTPKPPTATTTT
jgi:translation initiation factor IF-3